MAADPVEIDDLLAARERMMREMQLFRGTPPLPSAPKLYLQVPCRRG
jgi:hypothetical protein